MNEAPRESEPTAAISPRRRKSRRRLFAFVLCALILLFQEVVFRVAFPIPETTRFNRIRYQLLAEADPRFKPLIARGLAYDRLVFESAPDGWKHTHRLNRFGFRERDFSIEPLAGRKRVAVVGDSVTEGQGAAAGETIPAQLGEKLGASYEVLNLGVVAATMDKVTQLACDTAVLLKPETLVIVLYANDMPAPPLPPNANDNALGYFLNQIAKETAAAKENAYLPRLFVLGKRLAAGQPIYSRFFSPTIRYFAPVPDPTNPFREGSPPLPGLQPELESAMRAGQLNPWLVQQSEAMPGMIKADFALGGSPEAHLRVIRQVCQRAGVKLVVAYVPFHGTVHERYAQALKDLKMPPEVADALSKDPAYAVQAAQLQSICNRLNIPFVDTTGPLKSNENAGKPQFWPYDSHPRPEGYATISEAIAGGMQDR